MTEEEAERARSSSGSSQSSAYYVDPSSRGGYHQSFSLYGSVNNPYAVGGDDYDGVVVEMAEMNDDDDLEWVDTAMYASGVEENLQDSRDDEHVGFPSRLGVCPSRCVNVRVGVYAPVCVYVCRIIDACGALTPSPPAQDHDGVNLSAVSLTAFSDLRRSLAEGAILLDADAATLLEAVELLMTETERKGLTDEEEREQMLSKFQASVVSPRSFT